MTLPVSKVTADPALWPREELDEDRVRLFIHYFEEGDGGLLPPVAVARDGKHWLLADGWHRLEAAKRCDIKMIAAEVLTVPPGVTGRQFVYEHAVRTAVQSALPLSATERSAVVKRLIVERPDLSDRAIARLVGTSHVTVGRYRPDRGGGGQFDHPRTSPVPRPVEPSSDDERVKMTREEVLAFLAAKFPEGTPEPDKDVEKDHAFKCRQAARDLVADMVRLVKYDHDHIASEYVARALGLRFEQEPAGWWLAEMQRILFRAEQELPSATAALNARPL